MALKNIIDFYRMVPDAVPPMPADKSALSTLPLPAFQHCEAVRVASGLGWYVFPAKSAVLCCDGNATFVKDDGDERVLQSEFVGPEFTELWNAKCPKEFVDQEIPWLTAFSIPGIVQIWSGYFVSTAPGWSLLVKALTNVSGTGLLSSYEGIVRSDLFSPVPLFGNLRITKTGIDVSIDAHAPIFHIVPIKNETLATANTETVSDAFSGGTFDWDGFANTTRDASDDHTVGRYGAEMRKLDRQRDS